MNLSFWVVASIGLVLFALGVLSRPYVERGEAQQQLAVEDVKIRQLQQATGDLRVTCDSLADDPKLLARLIRMDLGYRRPGDEPLSCSSEALAPHRTEVELLPQAETRLDQVCNVFNRPVISHAALGSGLMLIGIALVWFDLPTRTRPVADV
jgi:hypothetical protein